MLTHVCRRLAPLTLALAVPAIAETRHDEQIWFNGTVMGMLPHSRVAYFAEIQPRFSLRQDRLQQLILRPAIGYRFSSAVTAYAGYAHVVSPIENGKDRNEERLFGQLSWTIGPVAGGTLSSRARIEHRRLSNGNDTGWRAREMLRYVHPLGNPKRTRFLGSVEPFWAFNSADWGARSGFDQVRTFLGAEVPIGGKSTIEVGYLNQAINDRGPSNRMNHVASISLFLRP